LSASEGDAVGHVEAAEPIRLALHEHERDAARRELPADEAAHAPIAAHHDVVLDLREGSFHALPPQDSPELAPHRRAQDLGGGVEEREDAAQREEHRERAALPRELVHLQVAHGGDGDDRHVERVEERPALDQVVAERPEHDEDDRDAQQDRERPHREAALAAAQAAATSDQSGSRGAA
jgi:hypothetical protein